MIIQTKFIQHLCHSNLGQNRVKLIKNKILVYTILKMCLSGEGDCHEINNVKVMATINMKVVSKLNMLNVYM